MDAAQIVVLKMLFPFRLPIDCVLRRYSGMKKIVNSYWFKKVLRFCIITTFGVWGYIVLFIGIANTYIDNVCLVVCIISMIGWLISSFFIEYWQWKKGKDKEYLKYSFTNNSILLKTETINNNGFYEVWRQENDEHSIQILCFNPETEKFQAFDKFHRMEESHKIIWEGCEYVREEDELWTPIELHFTLSWLKEHFQNDEN